MNKEALAPQDGEVKNLMYQEIDNYLPHGNKEKKVQTCFPPLPNGN